MDAVECRKPGGGGEQQRAAGRAPGAEDEEAPEELWRCRRCRVDVAHGRDRISVDGKQEHLQVNPAGIVHRFMTFRRCRNVVGVGPRSEDFTWFDGCAWQVLACNGCGVHLGWRFTGRDDFYALLVDAVERAEGT